MFADAQYKDWPMVGPQGYRDRTNSQEGICRGFTFNYNWLS
jgi:hypothetical protein